jgi:hypothetical protein
MGSPADAKGYVILIHDTPTIQLHLYDDFYTLFWRGRIDLRRMISCIADVVHESSEAFNVSRDSLNSVMATYGTQRDLTSIQFAPFPSTLLHKETIKHDNFVDNSELVIRFVRFDVFSTIPIILWADLAIVGGRFIRTQQEPELGFSSLKQIPASIFKLLDQSSSYISRSYIHDLRVILDSLI